MPKHTYVPILKRRRTKQTNYAKRKTMIISKSLLLCIRISNKHSTFQFIEPKIHHIELSKNYGANCGELHTGKFCNLFNLNKDFINEFIKISIRL